MGWGEVVRDVLSGAIGVQKRWTAPRHAPVTSQNHNSWLLPTRNPYDMLLEYFFCVQGHEDLRQDERVMQLFGLVNNMLATDRVTAERDLSIARYAVIPLSPNSGAAYAGCTLAQ